MRFLLDHLTLILAAAAGLWIGYALVCAVRARLNRPSHPDTGEDESRAAAVRDKIRRTIADRRNNPLPPPSRALSTAAAAPRPWYRRVWPLDPFGGPFTWIARKLRALCHRAPK